MVVSLERKLIKAEREIVICVLWSCVHMLCLVVMCTQVTDVIRVVISGCTAEVATHPPSRDAVRLVLLMRARTECFVA